MPIIILAGYCFLLPAIFFSKKIPIAFRLLSFTGVTLLCCWSTFLMVMWNEYPLNSATLGESHYYLVIGLETGDMNVSCLLYQCNSQDLECQTTNLSYVRPGICQHPTQLVTDEGRDEIHVLLKYEWDENYQLYSTFGEHPRHYLDVVEFENGTYYLVYSRDEPSRDAPFIYTLYKCTKDYSCQRLPFQYEVVPPFDYSQADMEINERKDGFDIIIDDRLIYTYSEVPHCHVEGCSLQDK